ncbi:MAG: prepilin-type N-terminal cleavage/methylation domain-containing protein [Candidatus Gracilibacteria bacterium]|nr:prepilin-type N-terminal cleavage/methylation domain-containing protein [Candidatus Gracilibacteria bacterium]
MKKNKGLYNTENNKILSPIFYILNSKKKAFTLVEILISITIFSFIITSGFYVFSNVSIGKVKLVEKTNIEKEAYYFSEKLFEEIKKGGVIDYEEYFNRRVVGNTTYQSGHYLKDTGYGNFGSGGIVGTTNYGDYIYLCRSRNGTSMGTGGCFNNTFNSYPGNVKTKPQRYGEYSIQFIDYNSNKNNDTSKCLPAAGMKLGDENCDGSIVGDDDDENIGIGPETFDSSGAVQELYLISGDKKTRTLFRWNVSLDSNKPTSATCDFTTQSNPTGDGCFGQLEFIKLNAKDWGVNHNYSSPSNGLYDGITDTWVVSPSFSGIGGIIAGSNTTNYRVPLFSDTVSVKNVKFFLYPNRDLNLAWKDPMVTSIYSPYLRISYTLVPSRKKRKTIKGEVPELNFSTTITLSDLFSQK